MIEEETETIGGEEEDEVTVVEEVEADLEETMMVLEIEIMILRKDSRDNKAMKGNNSQKVYGTQRMRNNSQYSKRTTTAITTMG